MYKFSKKKKKKKKNKKLAIFKKNGIILETKNKKQK